MVGQGIECTVKGYDWSQQRRQTFEELRDIDGLTWMLEAPLSDTIHEISELPQPAPLSVFRALSKHPCQEIHTLVVKVSMCLECVDHTIQDDIVQPPCVPNH